MAVIRRRTLVTLLWLACGIVLSTKGALALMPPHYEQIEPSPGGELDGDTITITGYTLSAAEDPVVTDLTADKVLVIELDLETKSVGRGLKMKNPPPGSIQIRSILRVRLPEVAVGHKIQMEFLGDVLVWTKAGPALKEQEMTVLTSVAELSARSGETVVFIGRPENSKAGPLLFDSDGQSVWCSGPHWPDELIGKRIQAVVRVTAATESSNLPVATQDAEGGWTQGVEAPQASKPSGSEPEGPAEVPSVVLKVLRHTLLR